ncbi:glutamine--fructose-6-phosphate transaminase (isomerizing) [Aerococcaceae bacterium WGS1372]
MCGIVGFIGIGNVQEVLINGLEKLEYRGYDSAGIFVVDEASNGHLFKEEGRIAKLKSEVDFDLSSVVGIGHTRWATHGPAAKHNAHPHRSTNQRFVLVHNGVIENYNEIREQYLQDVVFHSDTDSEVVVALIEYLVETENLSTKDAFKKALTMIEGSYAFGLVDELEPNVLYAAKNKSPLLIGKGDGFNVIVSDAMATIEHTNEYIEIKDKEIVVLTDNTIEIENFDGKQIDRPAYIVELDINDIEKGAYPFYMIKEIDEQPAVLRRLVKEYQNDDHQFELNKALTHDLLNSDRIYIIAAGTSYNAGWASKAIIEKVAQISTELHLASEFAYDIPLLSEKPFFIFLSQSGETADSRQALVKVNELGWPSLTITNVKGSTLSREATHTLLLHAGPEIAVASTKAYTAQITVMSILADVIGRLKGFERQFDMAKEISLVASAMESILSERDEIKAWVDRNLMETRNAFYIGRTADYFVAMEAALKLKEISYIQTEAFASGELKHGTIALIEEGVPVIALISGEVTSAHTRGNIEEVKARGANAIVISTQALSREDDQFVIPNVNELLTPLAMVVVTQMIAYYTALGRGLDVDKPRNLAKSVTVE